MECIIYQEWVNNVSSDKIDEENPTVSNMLQDQIIKRHEEDIKELKAVTYGLPIVLKRMEDAVTKLSDSVEKLLDNMEKKYQSKEVCKMCKEDNNSKFQTLEEKQRELEIEQDKLNIKVDKESIYIRNSLIGVLVAILLQLVVTYVLR